jgi:hypothetical protein
MASGPSRPNFTNQRVPGPVIGFTSNIGSGGPVTSGASSMEFSTGRPSGAGLGLASNFGRGVAPSSSFAAARRPQPPAAARHPADQLAARYRHFERFCVSRQPKPIAAEDCDDDKEYAQWAGGYVEVTDKLLSHICPCNLVGRPCPFDELEGVSCPMIRLCGQLEKWTMHKCPDKGFRTIIDAADNVPADYAEKGFGALNYYDSSDSESGGAALESSAPSETDFTDEQAAEYEYSQPNFSGKKVSFNDFSCGIKNDCSHIHWEVEINCRFVAWSHYKPVPCKQVLEKGRMCSCGHDPQTARQAARDAVTAHERSAERAGAEVRYSRDRWVY